MKALVQYVMTGPKQASIFCLGFGFFPVIGPWLSVAALSLIVLQLGFSSAVKVLPWAMIPGIVWLAIGDPSLIVLLVSTFVSAMVLQSSRSLALALVVSVCVSAGAFVVGQKLFSAQAEQLSKVMHQLLSSSPDMKRLLDDKANDTKGSTDITEQKVLEQAKAGDNSENAEVKVSNLDGLSTASGIFGSGSDIERKVAQLSKTALAFAGAFTACLILLVARWWQSLLYKPGAFQTEFHALRIMQKHILILCLVGFALVIGLDSLLEDKLGTVVAPLLLIPILLSGIALVHSLVAVASMNVHWLGMFYLALVFIAHFVVLLLIAVTLLDVIIDFRSRLNRSNTAGKDE